MRAVGGKLEQYKNNVQRVRAPRLNPPAEAPYLAPARVNARPPARPQQRARPERPAPQ